MPVLRRYPHVLMLAAIVLAGTALRVWGLSWGLQDATVSRRPHPDEWVVYWVFHWFDRRGYLNPCPQAGTQCFFDWGALYLYLAYAARHVLDVWSAFVPLPVFGGGTDHAFFVRAVLAGRLLSALLSAGTICIGYLLGSHLRGAVAGLVAATVIALSALLCQLAHFATPDSTTIFFLTLSLLLLIRAVDSPGPVTFGLAGASAGLTAGSEYHMALLAVPLLCAWALTGREGRSLAALAISFLLAWVFVNPYAVLQPAAFIDANLHSLRLRTVESGEQYGDRWTKFGPAWLYVVRYPFGYGAGFALTLWLIAGAVWAVFQRRRLDLLVLLWVLLYFVLVTLSPAKFMRYSAPLIPPLAALAGAFLVDAWRLRRGAIRVLLVAAALGTAAYSLAYSSAYAQLFAGQDPRQVATAWIERHAQPRSKIGFEHIPDGLVNLPYFVTDAGYEPCFSEFQPANLRSPARYFLVDDYTLEQHPTEATGGVTAFRAALASDRHYRRVLHVEPEPTFAGLRFPIADSPHDWRYPAHSITVYQQIGRTASRGGQCYPTMDAALAALYVPPPGGQG